MDFAQQDFLFTQGSGGLDGLAEFDLVLFKGLHHAVEGIGQIPDFAAGVNVGPGIERTPGDPLGEGLQGAQGLDQITRHGVGDERPDDQNDGTSHGGVPVNRGNAVLISVQGKTKVDPAPLGTAHDPRVAVVETLVVDVKRALEDAAAVLILRSGIPRLAADRYLLPTVRPGADKGIAISKCDDQIDNTFFPRHGGEAMVQHRTEPLAGNLRAHFMVKGLGKGPGLAFQFRLDAVLPLQHHDNCEDSHAQHGDQPCHESDPPQNTGALGLGIRNHGRVTGGRAGAEVCSCEADIGGRTEFFPGTDLARSFSRTRR